MPNGPLSEVFGFPADNLSAKAERFRRNRLCPHNNIVANCTKDKASDPLGVCSIFDKAGGIAITCPVRFRQDWLIAEHAAAFFFPANSQWTSLTEVRIRDKHGQPAGNIDLVLAAYDDQGNILDFGALEVQAVYISGNVRRFFDRYQQNPSDYLKAAPGNVHNWPRPDYLSSSRKRLVPQLLYKGGILKSWGKRQAIALSRRFFETLPALVEVDSTEADIVWLIYDLTLDEQLNEYQLSLEQRVYTHFEHALGQIMRPEVGEIDDFLADLQEKLDQKLENDLNAPEAPTLVDLL